MKDVDESGIQPQPEGERGLVVAAVRGDEVPRGKPKFEIGYPLQRMLRFLRGRGPSHRRVASDNCRPVSGLSVTIRGAIWPVGSALPASACTRRNNMHGLGIRTVEHLLRCEPAAL